MPDPVRRSTPAAVPAPLLLGALLLAGTAACGGGVDGGRAVERVDSAGIDVVMNRGPDQPLDWRLEPVFTVGGAQEGPEAFFRASDATVAASSDAAHDSIRHHLVRVDDAGDTILIASLSRPPGHQVDLGCVRIMGIDRLFEPSLQWTVAGNRVLLAQSARYEVELHDAAGRLTSVVRRDLAPVEATAEPAVRDIIGAPDGSFWVARGIKDHRVIDVFDPDGAYVGTLPEGTPFPAAFRGGDVVAVERDELDIPRVTVYRIARSDGNA